MTKERARVGIWSIEDLKSRCYVDEVDCWHWRGALSEGRPCVWFGPLYRATSLGYVLSYLVTGTRPKAGQSYRPTCCTSYCANPSHNRPQKRSNYTRCTTPTSIVRAKFAVAIEAKSKLKAKDISDILVSDEMADALGRKYGVSASYIRRIRQGKARATPIAGYSVFSFASA